MSHVQICQPYQKNPHELSAGFFFSVLITAPIVGVNITVAVIGTGVLMERNRADVQVIRNHPHDPQMRFKSAASSTTRSSLSAASAGIVSASTTKRCAAQFLSAFLVLRRIHVKTGRNWREGA